MPETITITSMLAAIKKAEEIGRPPTEYRMRPDDYEALKQQTKSQRTYPADWRPDSIFGLRIVLDAEAPRLPRKQA